MRQYKCAIAFGGGLALVAALLAVPTAAQETRTKAKAAPPARVAEPAKVVHPPGVRVPDYFGLIEPPLTPEQRTQIYEIQARALRDSEAVLTAAQKSSLQELRSKGGHPVRNAGAPVNEPARKPAARKKAG